MTQTVDFDIVGGFNNQRYSTIDAERSINLYPFIDPLGKKPKSLINTSGLINTNSSFGVATGGFRCQFVFNGNQYYVIGNSAFRETPAGVISLLGTLVNTTQGYVGITANTFQILFVDGVNGYIWDTISNTFTMITDPAFPNLPLDCTYLDEFFVVISGNTNTFQLSTIDQGLIWGADNSGTLNGLQFNSTSNITLTSGTNLYYQVGTPVAISSSSDANIPNGNYFISGKSGTTIIQVSLTDGGASLTAAGNGTAKITNNGQLQLGTVTSDTGTLVACRTLHRRLFLFSQFFTEVWENAGIGTNLPFRRNNSLLIEYGTPAVGSISVGFDKMFFLSQDRDGIGAVMEVVGSQAVPVSNSALDYTLSQYASVGQINDCRSFLIKENGLIFYRMNFTAAENTFVYNVTLSDPSNDASKLWHEEQPLGGGRHVAQTHAYLNGINYVGHYSQPILYIMDGKTYTNDGVIIPRTRITRAFGPKGFQRRRIDRIQLDLLQGNLADLDPTDLNLDTESHQDLLTESMVPILLEQQQPQYNVQNLLMFFSMSKDGGQSYGNNITAPLGNLGQRSFRTVWRKLGVIPRGQYFVGMFQFFAPVPCVIFGGSWAYEDLPE